MRFLEAAIGIASHQVDVFILEPCTDRHLGRLCDFNAEPSAVDRSCLRCRSRGVFRSLECRRSALPEL